MTINPLFTKQELFKKYYKLPDRFIRETINNIIKDCRNISLSEAKKKRNITPKECKEFINIMGEV
ncbi:hypothetical protein [uncultured Tenacibaculum sp.]|uniref:hypothetical protein n=1 Tax=uncultured Tenacibaculum sp. TaxID=174713 RepID=UPI0026198A28|nr:hypothetical protein [uncultured Tenacibaculum sp.]